MPRLFEVPAGTSYPATLADYELAVKGKRHRRVPESDEAQVIAAPYEEIIPSWLANGVKEVKDSGVRKR